MKASYYAIFEKTDEAVEVEFPDLKNCLTFGDTHQEALEMAEDVLKTWLETVEPEFIKPPSTMNMIKEHVKKHYSSKSKVKIIKIDVELELNEPEN